MIAKKKNPKNTVAPARILARVMKTQDKEALAREVNEMKNFIKARKGDKSICLTAVAMSGENQNSAYLYIFDTQPKLVVRISDHDANPRNVENRTSGRIKGPSEVEEFTDKWSMYHAALNVTKKIK